MENFGAKNRQNQNVQNPIMKSDKCLLSTQILLRILAIAFTLAATSIILTSKQAVTVFGIEMDARYSYSSAFKFFAITNMITMALLLAGCAAATAVGYVGKYGQTHSGWLPICDHVDKFCRKVSHSIMLSYIAMILYLCLTIISANQSRKIMV
ncbi:CASP-like protein 1F1 isoform X2 [Solanum pennellii]|uniref:CASP-like protein n=1 Tax=Solanum pennellii TaxID=28526 RepID=A0ABM1VDQ8_SOLPN|nr:CASP-like protein 1F1 isoform X2 [Solanum pennellii]